MEEYTTKNIDIVAWMDYHKVKYTEIYQDSKGDAVFVYDQSLPEFDFQYRQYQNSEYKRVLEWRKQRILPLTRTN